MRTAEILFISFGSISALFSSSIVITGLVFPSIMLTSEHPFSNMLFIIAFCDMIGSISISFGYPKDGTDLCTAQAFMRIFFFPLSWLWTTALVYHMYCMIVYKKLFISMRITHLICWCTAIIIALLPLVEQGYGQDDELNGKYTCFWAHATSRISNYSWIVSVFYGPLLACTLLMYIYMFKINEYIKKSYVDEVIREKALYKSLFWYPIGMIVCWISSLICYWICFISANCSLHFFEASDIIATQYGTICAIVFFAGSKVVRNHWIELFQSILLSTQNRSISTTSSLSDSNIRTSFLCDTIDIEDATIYTNNLPTDINRYTTNNGQSSFYGIGGGMSYLRNSSITSPVMNDNNHAVYIHKNNNVQYNNSNNDIKNCIDNRNINTTNITITNNDSTNGAIIELSSTTMK